MKDEKRFAAEIMGLELRAGGCTFETDRPLVAARHLLRVVEGSTRPGLERYRGQANRFAAFNPEERQIMLALLESHLNAVSSIGLTTEVRVAGYLAKLEALEAECKL